MKNEIIEFSDLRNNIEFYLQRPNPFCIYTIILVFTIIIASVLWMCLCRMEVKVKGKGEIVYTINKIYITNLVDGVINECYVKDGDKVKKGDLLYELNYSIEESKINKLKNQIIKNNEKSIALKNYINWLKNMDKKFKLNKDNIYYKYYYRKINYISNIKGIELKNKNSEIEKNNLSKIIMKRQLDDLRNKEKLIKRAKKSVKKVDNLLTDTDVYYYIFVKKYINDYNSIIEANNETIEDISTYGKKVKINRNTKNELRNLQINVLLELDLQYVENKDKIMQLENEMKVLEETGKVLKQNKEAEVKEQGIIEDELFLAVEEKEILKEKKNKLIQDYNDLKNFYKKSKVYANESGNVNFLEDNIKIGNYVYAGKRMMSIIPEDKEYFAEVYIKNCDIGNIQLGMKVKSEIDSFPSEEYGYISGYVEEISSTKKLEDKMGTYYLLKVKLDFDTYERNINIKDGMSCESQIITRKVKIIKYLFEKIDLLD